MMKKVFWILSLLPFALASVPCVGSCDPSTYPSPFSVFEPGFVFATLGNGPIPWKAGLAHPGFFGQVFTLLQKFIPQQADVGFNLTVKVIYHGVLQIYEMPQQPDNITADSPQVYTDVLSYLIKYQQLKPISDKMQEFWYLRGYTLKDDMPAQARDEVFVNGHYYGVPFLSDARGFKFNPQIFRQCGVDLPPTPANQTLLPIWTYNYVGKLFKKFKQCGIKFPYWQQECTTLVYIMSWFQSRKVSLTDENGNFALGTPAAQEVWMEEILPALRGAGDDMVCEWINCTAPDMAEYLRTPLGSYDKRRGCRFGQLTCQIPQVIFPDTAMGMVTRMPPGGSTYVPGRLGFQAYWYLTISARSGEIQQEISWNWIQFNVDFLNPDGVIAGIYQNVLQSVPILNAGRSFAWAQARLAASPLTVYHQKNNFNMANPHTPPEGMALFEVEGVINKALACLYFKNGTFDYCINDEMATLFRHQNLPDCQEPGDLIYTYSPCDDPEGLISTAKVTWDPAKVNTSCVITFKSQLPQILTYEVPCAYLTNQSANGVALTTLMALTFIISFVNIMILVLYRQTQAIRARSWTLQPIFCLGCAIASAASMSIQGDLTGADCATMVGMFTFGYVLCMTTITIKLWRIYEIFVSKSLMVQTFPLWKILIIFVGLLGCNLAFFIAWTVQTEKIKVTIVSVPPVGNIPHYTCNLGSSEILVPWLVFDLILVLIQVRFVSALSNVNTSTFNYEMMEKFAEYNYMKVLVIISLAVLAGVIPIVVSSNGQLNALYTLNICLQLITLLLCLTSCYSDVRAIWGKSLWDAHPTRFSLQSTNGTRGPGSQPAASYQTSTRPEPPSPVREAFKS